MSLPIISTRNKFGELIRIYELTGLETSETRRTERLSPMSTRIEAHRSTLDFHETRGGLRSDLRITKVAAGRSSPRTAQRVANKSFRVVLGLIRRSYSSALAAATYLIAACQRRISAVKRNGMQIKFNLLFSISLLANVPGTGN